ncbi:MAG: transporter [Desulfobacterales bacterium]|nr:transporter [Desulfobacterales bacterium]
MKKHLTGLVSVLFVLCTVFLAGNAFAEHYVSGIEGIKGASVPPPGMYYKMYNAFYQADDVNNSNGDTVIDNLDATVFANVHRFIWVSDDIKFLGGDYGADITVPLIYKDMGLFNEDNFGLGDIILEPVLLSWHKPSYDLSFGLAAFLPTGKYDNDQPGEAMASPGMDMYTLMTTFGATYYFDNAKKWTASILSRYEIHSEEGDTDITRGDDFHFEWGVGKTVADVWDIGLAGYCQWQVSSDKGTGSTDTKDQVYAIGPEVSMFYPPGMFALSLRALTEFEAEDRPEGTMISLVFTKIF